MKHINAVVSIDKITIWIKINILWVENDPEPCKADADHDIYIYI